MLAVVLWLQQAEAAEPMRLAALRRMRAMHRMRRSMSTSIVA
jgi:hypothetical protein